MSDLQFGDYVYCLISTPGRYVGDGICLFVSAMTNDVHACDENVRANESARLLPTVTDDELIAAGAMLRLLQKRAKDSK